MDPVTRRRSLAEQTEGTLFDVAPNIRGEAPSVPNQASEDAADFILKSPIRRNSWRKILLYLSTQDRPVSMVQISEATGLKINAVCGRLSHKELRPDYIATHPQACQSSAVPALRVDGFTITKLGRDRVRRATTEHLPGH